MSNIIIKTISLKKTFKNNNREIKLFSDVNLSIKKGELVALTGPSGSGKSSLLYLLALLDKPTSGKIFLNGKNTINITEEEENFIRRDKISLIFQDNNLLSDFTAYENVTIPLIIKNEKNRATKEITDKILKDFKIFERKNHFPAELSGGEQQRVAIARTIAAKTDLVLADEPTGNLDYKTSQDIFAYFKKLKKLNKAIIFATHNRELANKADYKLVIFNGNIKKTNAKS